MLVVRVAALIALATCSALSPALTVMVELPVPVRTVGAIAAPAPWIVAGVRGPTSGLDAKVAGLSRLEPGTPACVFVVVGWLGRFALYVICDVCWAGIRLLLNCSVVGMLPVVLPVVGS